MTTPTAVRPESVQATARHVTIVRTAQGWTVEGGGRALAYYDSPPATPQDVGGLAEHYRRKGYQVGFRDERGGLQG